ncbi:MAG: OmpA family protein [Crocinitomicaceae bacterium]|nr:OmpA family protein [Crocinitomicaceae bacterium]
MMKRIILSAISLLVLTTSSVAQTDNELIRMGDAAMANGQYSNAVYYYAFVLYKVQQGEEALYYAYEISPAYKEPEKNEDGTVKPPENPTAKQIELIHKLADAYRLADDYKNAEIWYAAAMKYPLEQFPYVQYFYGVSLMYNSKFGEAMTEFEGFQSLNNDPDNQYYQLSNSKIASCQFAMNPNNTKEGITITNPGDVINGGSTSFGLQFVSDEYMIFSSARIEDKPDSIVSENENPLELYMLDIYLVKLNEDGSFGAIEKFPFSINSSEYHEASAVISEDGNAIFFTRMDPDNRNETKIYASRKFNNTWLAPFALDNNVNMDGFRSMNPSLSSDGKTLFFATNRPGGEGGMDIWMTTLGPNGETTEPVNLGNQVNTFDDEITPFYHDITQTLYFASGGHIGFGGLDIYATKWNEETEWWSESVNVGAPVNSSRDDSYYIVDEQLRIGYVSSDREACSECDSIYNLSIHCNKIYQIERPEMKFFISGYVYDATTNEIIPGAKIEFKDANYKWEHFEIIADENGYYQHELVPNLELFMRASQTDYFADKAVVFTLGETESRNYQQDFYLEKIPKGEITIEGIEYDFDSANLRPESEKILDNLIEFLELNSNLTIEIRSHTDMRGNDDYNLRLSERRAQSVVDYLVDHGIPRERLMPKGYGETMPAEVPGPDGTIVTLTPAYIEALPDENSRETAHQRNRRTAFFVLEQN